MPTLITLAAFAAFAAFWALILTIISRLGGWAALARHYRDNQPAVGRAFHMQSARFGWMDYNGCLTIHVSDGGIRLALFPLFRIAHPTLLLPWSELQVEQVRDKWYGRDVLLAVGSPVLARVRLPLQVIDAARQLKQLPNGEVKQS